MRAITAAAPPRTWGASAIWRSALTRSSRQPRRAYLEPSVGIGGVFLRRSTPAPVEVINDLSGDVANMFRVVRRHYEPFADEPRWPIAGRAKFEHQRALGPRLMTYIERAVRFLYP